MPPSSRHPRLLRYALAATWLAVAFNAAVALVPSSGPGLASFSGSWVYMSAEVAAVAICGFRVWHRKPDRWAWALITLGLLTWTGGDLVWTLWLDHVSNP